MRIKHLDKIKAFPEILRIVNTAKRAGKRIVTTNGCFDIIHIGHIRNLAEAKSHGDVLIVGVNSDASVRRYKGDTRPINPQKERAEVIASLGSVDHVFIFTTDTAIPWLKKLKPHVHAKGGDRTLAQMPERETVEMNGGKMVRLKFVKHHSTTKVIEKVARTLR
jgi:rfaE bifunctional protein nucleotidyltransferase chain/domain